MIPMPDQATDPTHPPGGTPPTPVDPVTAYLQMYGKGGASNTPPTPTTGTDPVASYLQKYGKGGTGNIDLRQASDDTRVAPSKPKTDGTPLVGLGAAESGLQGLLGGFADEIGGAGNATINSILHPTTASGNQWKSDYEEYRDVGRGLDKGYAQAHPIAHGVAELTGGVLPAIATGGAAEGGLLARMGIGAATGAAFGGVNALGNAEGTPTQQLQTTVKALPASAILGGMIPALGSAGGSLIAKLFGNSADQNALAKIATALKQDQITPDMLAQRGDEAAQITPQALDMLAQNRGMTPTQPSPMIAADLGGKNMAGLVRWATSHPSTFKDQFITDLEGRNAGQFDRIVQGANQATGNQYPNVTAARDALEATRSANAATNYPAAYAQGPYGGPVLDQAMQSPAFAKALGIGQKLADQDDIVQALKNGSSAPAVATTSSAAPAIDRLSPEIANDPKMMAFLQQKGFLPQNASSSPSSSGVSIKALNFAKQYLDQGISRGFDASGGFDHTTATVTRDLLQQVLADAKGKVPALGNAIDTYAADSKPLNALDMGQQALRLPPDELSQATQAMNPQERQGLVAGAMDALKNKGASVADKSDLSAQFLSNPAMRQRFQAITPTSQGFDQLMNLRDQEQSMARTLKAAIGGSDTERNRLLSGAMNTVTGPDIAVAPISMRRAMMRVAGRLGQRYESAQNSKVADALGPYLQAPVGSQSFADFIQSLTESGAKQIRGNQRGQMAAALAGIGSGSHADQSSP